MIVHKIPEEQKQDLVDTLSLKADIMDYLHKNNFIIVDDIVKRQEEIPHEMRYRIYAYFIFGVIL